MRHLPWLTIGLLSLFLTCITLVKAESLAVSLRVGDTKVSFDGYSSPLSFITIYQNDQVIGTTQADNLGNWSKTLDADNPGLNTYDLTATDLAGRTTPGISYNLNLTANAETTVSHLVFPPTLSLTDLTLSGSTHPLANLLLLTSAGNHYPLSVDAQGNWQYLLTTDLTPGTYTLYLTATMPGGYLSLASTSLTITIGESSDSTLPQNSTQPSSSTLVPSSSPIHSPSLHRRSQSPSSQAVDTSSVPTHTLATASLLEVTLAKNISAIPTLLTIFALPSFIFAYYRFSKRTKKTRS